MAKNHLHLASMEAIIKEAGAERVSVSAKEALRKNLEDYALKISKDAIRNALHAGRKTVNGEDVNSVLKPEQIGNRN